MTGDKVAVKIIFGIVIFMFSLALAYFTASYVNKEQLFDYWTTLLMFAVVYVAVGIAVYRVFPVSLGFLFSADVLILHLLFENFGTIPNVAKTLIIGLALVTLYGFAWMNMKDRVSP